jgi:hypothetical protein
MRRRRLRRARGKDGPAAWLAESERLYADFRQLTPFVYRPFARSFKSFAQYERWKRAQTNPWYR